LRDGPERRRGENGSRSSPEVEKTGKFASGTAVHDGAPHADPNEDDVDDHLDGVDDEDADDEQDEEVAAGAVKVAAVVRKDDSYRHDPEKKKEQAKILRSKYENDGETVCKISKLRIGRWSTFTVQYNSNNFSTIQKYTDPVYIFSYLVQV
jgi:hypothetical protein